MTTRKTNFQDQDDDRPLRAPRRQNSKGPTVPVDVDSAVGKQLSESAGRSKRITKSSGNILPVIPSINARAPIDTDAPTNKTSPATNTMNAKPRKQPPRHRSEKRHTPMGSTYYTAANASARSPVAARKSAPRTSGSLSSPGAIRVAGINEGSSDRRSPNGCSTVDHKQHRVSVSDEEEPRELGDSPPSASGAALDTQRSGDDVAVGVVVGGRPNSAPLNNSEAKTLRSKLELAQAAASIDAERTRHVLSEAGMDGGKRATGPSSSPIVAELAPTEDEIASQLQSRMEREMEERLQHQVEERLKAERQAQVIAEAVEIEPDPESPKRTTSIDSQLENNEFGMSKTTIFGVSKLTWCVLSVFLVAGIVGGVVASIILSGGDGGDGGALISGPTNPPTVLPTLSPTIYTSPEFDTLLDLIGPHVTSSLERFEEPSSVEYKALDWMANNDSWTFPSDLPERSLESLVQRYAVALFYLATNGPLWTKQFRFLSNESICEWYDLDTLAGLSCDITGNVTGMYLSNAGIRGTIPSEIALLESLGELELFENLLFGTLPPSFYNLQNLEYTILADCALSGTLAPEIGTMTNLRYFNIYDNKFRGQIPTQIGLLTDTLQLQMHFNAFSGTIPTEFGELTNLQILDLQRNQLLGSIPLEIGSMAALQELYLEENRLSGTLPAELGRLSELTFFYVFDNFLSGSIPSEYAMLTRLNTVYFEMNDLKGTMDDAFCKSRLEPIPLLWADCFEPVEITCSCCTHCCNDNIGCVDLAESTLEPIVLEPVFRRI